VIDGVPEQEPGVFPEGISPDEADGNSVILDIGGGNYALYGHFQPGSIRVKEGDRVRQGDVLALVGSSGNSLAPHLHFHVMSTPLSLASNGLPYEVDALRSPAGALEPSRSTKLNKRARVSRSPRSIRPTRVSPMLCPSTSTW
jgi:murein DD-endopeptidase MepM/ murein hydrolase activator NlpD